MSNNEKPLTVTDAVLQAFKESRERKAAAAQAEAGKAQPITMKAIAADEHGVIFGVGGAAGDAAKLDLDGEFISKADLMSMAFDFCASETRAFKANHKDAVKASLVASWIGAPIVKDGDATRLLKAGEKLTPESVVVGINIEKGNETHWFVGVKPDDEDVLTAAKAGEIVGFSWAADVVKTEVA